MTSRIDAIRMMGPYSIRTPSRPSSWELVMPAMLAVAPAAPMTGSTMAAVQAALPATPTSPTGPVPTRSREARLVWAERMRKRTPP
ncbi:MAG: hypothetical protein WKF47_12215 [Geodermatophilaceae bacterium]